MLAECLEWSQRWLQRLPQLVPSSCALCGASHATAICPACRQQYFGQRRQRCRRCAATLTDPAAVTCGACLAQPPAFDVTVVAADYLPPVDQLVLALKFGSRLALAPLFAQMLRDALLQDTPDAMLLPDVLTAVPLGPQRLRERGFNQALEIAKPLSRLLGVTLTPSLLVRLRDTQAQSQLHGRDRHDNLRQAFTVPQDFLEMVRGRHVGVVDDVITTGETLNELAATLKRFGAARVTNLVFARTLPK